MNCPKCGSMDVYVTDSRPHGASTRRKRKCAACAYRWSTIEVPEQALREIKNAVQHLEKPEP